MSNEAGQGELSKFAGARKGRLLPLFFVVLFMKSSLRKDYGRYNKKWPN